MSEYKSIEQATAAVIDKYVRDTEAELTELRAIVRGVTRTSPDYWDGARTCCRWCYNPMYHGKIHHDPDCLYLRARKYVEEHPE